MKRRQGMAVLARGKSKRAASAARVVAAALLIASGVASAPTASASSACSASAAIDPLRLYGDEIRFDVLRNGAQVGSHTVSFGKQGDRLSTSTRFEVKVEVLFFTAYRYVYASEGSWIGGCLDGLIATTDDNGAESVVRVSRSDQQLIVEGPQGAATAAPETLPTEHWAYGVVSHDAVINTITGRINRVDISRAETEAVKMADGRAITARRYVYGGELDNEVWYDAEGRWVKMRFPAKDGSSIEYVCVKCGIDHVASRS